VDRFVGPWIVLALLVALPGMVAGGEGGEPADRVMLVLDASGSMWGRAEGRTKIEIAREVVRDLLADWQEGTHLGLAAYGHRRKGDCQDIETLLPVGAVRPEEVQEAIDGLVPRGKTPIGDAVRHAARELRASEEPATVVLVSDGRETCDADPCALGSELERSGVDFTVHVVGFDVGEAESGELRCLAEETGGRYFTASSAESLLDALRRAIVETRASAPEPEPERVERTFPVQSGCQGDGLVCEPPYELAVETRGLLQVRFDVSSIHCGPIRMRVGLDGDTRHTSEPLGYGGREPVSTEVFDLGPVEPGPHTVQLQAIGVPEGCIADHLGSWAGSVTVWTSK